MLLTASELRHIQTGARCGRVSMRLEKGPRFFVLEAIQDGISWLVRIHNEKKQTVADGAMDGRTIEKELCETVSKLKQNLIEGGKAS